MPVLCLVVAVCSRSFFYYFLHHRLYFVFTFNLFLNAHKPEHIENEIDSSACNATIDVKSIKVIIVAYKLFIKCGKKESKEK